MKRMRFREAGLGSAVFIALSLVFSSASWAQESPSDESLKISYGTRNIGDASDADAAVEELSKRVAQGQGLILYHAGESIPAQLTYMVQRLALKKVEVQIVQIDPNDLSEDLTQLKDAPFEYQELMTYPMPDALPVQSKWKKVLNAGKSFVRDWFGLRTAGRVVQGFFGIPRLRDLSLWISSPLRATHKTAAIGAGTAVVSMGATFLTTYLMGPANAAVPVEAWRPMLALGTWVYLNIYQYASFSETMSQGKSLMKVAGSGWKVTPNPAFFWSASFLRSLLTNAIVQTAILGPLAIFQEANIDRNLKNSVLSVFSRSELDRLISERTPRNRNADGEVIVMKGQWTPAQAERNNMIWNTIHGFCKNLSLVGDHPLFWVPFGALTVINVGLMVKKNFPAWSDATKRAVSALSTWVGLKEKETNACNRTFVDVQKLEGT